MYKINYEKNKSLRVHFRLHKMSSGKQKPQESIK